MIRQAPFLIQLFLSESYCLIQDMNPYLSLDLFSENKETKEQQGGRESLFMPIENLCTHQKFGVKSCNNLFLGSWR